MKNLIIVFLAALIFTSCNESSLIPEDSTAELLSADQKNSDGDFSLTTPENSENLGYGFSLRNGTQRINDNQTNEGLERGVGVPIPLFSEETVIVKSGSWVTLRFGIQNLFAEGEPCPEELSEEQIGNILEAALSFEETEDFAMYFDGEPIEIAPHFRTELIRTVFGTSQGITGCYSQIAWRYYLNPQSKGDHEFKVTFGDTEYSRIIRWENKK